MRSPGSKWWFSERKEITINIEPSQLSSLQKLEFSSLALTNFTSGIFSHVRDKSPSSTRIQGQRNEALLFEGKVLKVPGTDFANTH